MTKHKFITFEGIEGSGKSTQTKFLADFFQKNKTEFVLTREPGGTSVAEEIRKILISGAVDKLDGITETLLNFAARRDHVQKLIKPALGKNQMVICDRFFDSTFAYQGFGYGVNFEVIKNIQKSAIADFAPDITFLIDLEVEIAMERIKLRAENNRYEKMDVSFHKKVRSGFLEIAKKYPQRIKVINGDKSAEEINQEILEIIKG